MLAPHLYAAIAVTSLLAVQASATVLYVDLNSPNPQPPYVDWPTAATNIQDAIEAASPGDRIVVTNGVYASRGGVFAAGASNRVAITKSIEVTSVGGPSQTIILGGQGVYPLRCAYITNGAMLSGFTLSNSAIEQ